MRKHNTPNLVILGASARAAAFSALRAGFRPWCADLFADADLQCACKVVRIDGRQYPQDFLRLINETPACPWMYVGALENRPSLVAQLAKVRELWGNDADLLAKVRRPWEVAKQLHRAGSRCPAVCRPHSALPDHGQWLVKPMASAGGRGIHFWSPSEKLPNGKIYLQEYIKGDACAAIYVGKRDKALLLGVTRQLVGASWLHAKPFQYCGSVGPLMLNDETKEIFIKLGNALVEGFGLRGLFGVDYVLSEGIPYPIEINPRYTASVEVLEHATGLKAMQLHANAFEEELPEEVGIGFDGQQQIIGKAILYARGDVVMPAHGPWSEALHQPLTALRDFADIPNAGSTIPKGSPILSVFARAGSLEVCTDTLQQRVQSLDHWLFGR